MKEIEHRDKCRICGGKEFETVIDLGPAPLANSYRTPEQSSAGEKFYPLKVYRCQKCELFQLRDIVNPEILFRNYDYATGGTSETLPEHFKEYARKVGQDLGLEEGIVVELGSNDGTLLKAFQALGFEVLGIDPAENLAERADKRGVPTWPEFFNQKTAEKILDNKGEVDLVVANNVLGHVDNLNEVIENISEILDEDGHLVFEVPYLVDLVEKNEFDTIYHEHLSYFSIKPLKRLFDNHGMTIRSIEQKDIHGGSIRVKVSNKREANCKEAESLIQQESDKLNEESIRDFRKQVYTIRENLKTTLENIRGKKVVGYGAPAKAAILLNYANIDDEIGYAVDELSTKQGKTIPGTSVKIHPVNKFRRDNVDYCLLLAWNYRDEILEKEKQFLKSGGKVINPIPEPSIYRYSEEEERVVKDQINL